MCIGSEEPRLGRCQMSQRLLEAAQMYTVLDRLDIQASHLRYGVRRFRRNSVSNWLATRWLYHIDGDGDLESIGARKS